MYKSHSIAMYLLILLLFLTANSVMAQEQVSVYVDEEPVHFPDQGAFIDANNRTLVPIRFVSEELGANVHWKGSNREIEIQSSDKITNLYLDIDILPARSFSTHERGFFQDTREVAQ